MKLDYSSELGAFVRKVKGNYNFGNDCGKENVRQKMFSNSIIQQVITKEIITVTVVWKSDPN